MHQVNLIMIKLINTVGRFTDYGRSAAADLDGLVEMENEDDLPFPDTHFDFDSEGNPIKHKFTVKLVTKTMLEQRNKHTRPSRKHLSSKITCLTCKKSWFNIDEFLKGNAECIRAGQNMSAKQMTDLRQKLLLLQTQSRLEQLKQLKNEAQATQQESGEVVCGEAEVNTDLASTSVDPTDVGIKIELRDGEEHHATSELSSNKRPAEDSASAQPDQKRAKRTIIRREYICESCSEVHDDVDEFIEHMKTCFLHGAAINRINLEEIKQQLTNVKQSNSFVMSNNDLKDVGETSRKLSDFRTLYLRRKGAVRAPRPKKQTDENTAPKKRKPAKPKEKGTFLCSFCSKILSTAAALRTHEVHVHGEKKFECEKCGKKFTTSSNMRKHMDVHNDVNKFMCKYCGRLFKHLKVLQKHELAEVDAPIKTYTCDLCGTKFSHKHALKRHEKSHQRDYEFKCGMCDMSFRFEYVLRLHQRSHTESYQCNICSRTFGYKSHCVRHMMSQHGERAKLPCPLCSMAFFLKEKLDEHSKKCHGISSGGKVHSLSSGGGKRKPGKGKVGPRSSRTIPHHDDQLSISPVHKNIYTDQVTHQDSFTDPRSGIVYYY